MRVNVGAHGSDLWSLWVQPTDAHVGLVAESSKIHN